MTSQRVCDAVDRLRTRAQPDNPDIATLIGWHDYAVKCIDEIDEIIAKGQAPPAVQMAATVMKQAALDNEIARLGPNTVPTVALWALGETDPDV